MNSTNMLAFAALVLASLTSSQDLKAETSCLVSDPSDTPLNVRSRPNGPIVILLSRLLQHADVG